MCLHLKLYVKNWAIQLTVNGPICLLVNLMKKYIPKLGDVSNILRVPDLLFFRIPDERHIV